ncbi:hypothetical protein EM308_14260 [Flavobacterium gilvum]|uniref:F5/8 type C domain-containing protein n=2 Tax=Flavobacterium gilvum TaxID=1492737 RepID=A0AAC9N7T1_9FLAO|nr:hypothetical protein EM308_14260 [Flavobacterium gilvum]
MMLQAQFKPATYCNPMNISYRFSIDPLAYKDYSWGAKMPGRDMKKGEYDSFREAADPTMVVFKNEYYLFASKSGGYWVSKDLLKWDFITTNDLPLEAYAPTAVVIGDSLYFATTDCKWIYKTDDPKKGKWTIANESNPFPLDIWPKGFQDLCLFLDDDQRLYLYYGCVRPTMGVELDVKNGFKTIGELKEIHAPSTKYAWNNIGLKSTNMLVEGPWMTKHNGKYYLQYATFADSYVDGVCVSDNPLSGFEVAQSNPFSEKAKGFVTGIGHGSTFSDNFSNYWHVTCVHSPIIKHNFERRLGMFPAGFDKDGVLFCDSYFGDYPHIIPKKEVKNSKSLFTGWVLLSYKKPTETSSSMGDFKSEKAVDENLRTYWSAETANKGEWFSVDLLQPLTIRAVQINFAEHLGKAKGRADLGGFQYVVEYSNDKLKWDTLIDKSNNKEDLSHDYVEIEKAVKARYVRITNIHVPDGMFALYDFRVFGNGGKKLNQQAKDFSIVRDAANGNKVKLNWSKIPTAIGYNIRYGVAKDKMYMNRMVYSNTSLDINDLNSKSKYYFSIDVFNEAGVERGKEIYELK